MNQARARKLGDRIAVIVAEMLERRIKDPRLGFVTVTEARVTGDLREATVFYTVYGSDDEVAGTKAALASATGLIRSEVGKQTGLKHTPSISFSQDTVPDTARTIEDLVERARAADALVAAARVDAVPAGDPDPYRTADDTADEADDTGRRPDDDSGLMTSSDVDWARALKVIDGADQVFLACHVRPDADALGSMLAVMHALCSKPGRPPVVVASFGDDPFEVPGILRFLPGIGLLSPPGAYPPRPDVMVSFDAASIDRLGVLTGPAQSAGELIVLDHHASNSGFGTINLVDPAAAATAVLAAGLIDRLGIPLTEQIALGLYAGLVTDTGSFKFSATTPQVHELAARLLVDRHRPRRRVPRTLRPRALRLPGHARRRPPARGPRARCSRRARHGLDHSHKSRPRGSRPAA